MSTTLVKQTGRIGHEQILAFPPDQEEFAMAIHKEAIVFDIHLFGVVIPDRGEDCDAWLADHRFHFAYDESTWGTVQQFLSTAGSPSNRDISH